MNSLVQNASYIAFPSIQQLYVLVVIYLSHRVASIHIKIVMAYYYKMYMAYTSIYYLHNSMINIYAARYVQYIRYTAIYIEFGPGVWLINLLLCLGYTVAAQYPLLLHRSRHRLQLQIQSNNFALSHVTLIFQTVSVNLSSTKSLTSANIFEKKLTKCTLFPSSMEKLIRY